MADRVNQKKKDLRAWPQIYTSSWRLDIYKVISLYLNLFLRNLEQYDQFGDSYSLPVDLTSLKSTLNDIEYNKEMFILDEEL